MTQSAQSLITVLVADDHPLLREGVAAILAHEPDILLIAEAATGREAMRVFSYSITYLTVLFVAMAGDVLISNHIH